MVRQKGVEAVEIAGVAPNSLKPCAPCQAADAMYAPVVNRFHVHAIPVTPASRAYMDVVMALPSWKAWIAGGEAEPWHHAGYDDI